MQTQDDSSHLGLSQVSFNRSYTAEHFPNVTALQFNNRERAQSLTLVPGRNLLVLLEPFIVSGSAYTMNERAAVLSLCRGGVHWLGHRVQYTLNLHAEGCLFCIIPVLDFNL